MKKYMVVCLKEDGTTEAWFYDTYAQARNARGEMECGFGEYTQLYEGIPTSEGDARLYEYILLEA